MKKLLVLLAILTLTNIINADYRWLTKANVETLFATWASAQTLSVTKVTDDKCATIAKPNTTNTVACYDVTVKSLDYTTGNFWD